MILYLEQQIWLKNHELATKKELSSCQYLKELYNISNFQLAYFYACKTALFISSLHLEGVFSLLSAFLSYFHFYSSEKTLEKK